MERKGLYMSEIKSQLIENGDIIQIVGLVNGMAIRDDVRGYNMVFSFSYKKFYKRIFYADKI